MSSIDSFNIDKHSRYAVDTALKESFKQDYNIDDLTDTRVISDHAKVLDFVPKPGAFIGLFGENLKRRWAYFEKPPGFSQNRVFFFGVSNALDKCKADSQRIASIDCSHTDAKEQAERQKEKNTLATNNTLVTTLHEDYEYIMGRTHHFVQA